MGSLGMSDLNVMNVLITGGGGRIAYSLIPLICRGGEKFNNILFEFEIITFKHKCRCIWKDKNDITSTP